TKTEAGPPIDVPYKDKELAAKSAAKIKEYEERLKNGAEGKELDEFEAQLLKKLIAGKAERAKSRGYDKTDLRLELKLPKQRIFIDAEQAKHADLLEAATRTGDAEEKQLLDTYERDLLIKLKTAYAKGD